MGRISSGVGLISGINSKDIIDQLIALESQPKDVLQKRIDSVNEQKLAFTDLQTRLTSLRVSGQTLKKASTFQSSVATSSDEDVITATASSGAAIGSFQFQVARLVTAQQTVSKGFADFDSTAVGAGTITIEQGGGDLNHDSLLSELNGSAGVRRGVFRVTDRSGASTTIDITNAVSLNDVIRKINTSLNVSLKATIQGDKLVITDQSGQTASNLVIQDVGDGHAAEDLGIVANTNTNSVTGTDINFLSRSSNLSQLNDGRGVRTAASGSDFHVALGDGTTFDIALAGKKTIGDVLDAINTAGAGKIKAEVAAGSNGIKLTDLSGGGGAFTVAALNSSKAITDLGLDAAASAGVITGKSIIAGLNTVLVSSLNGGSGFALGTISVRSRAAGSPTSIDLSSATSVQDVLDTINNANVGVKASLNSSGNGIQIVDASAGTGSLVIADVTGTTATDFGIAGTFTTSVTTVKGANLQRQWVSENTLLADYNGGKGVARGKFKITNSRGATATIDLTQGNEVRLQDVIQEINSKGIGVTASINAHGDGLLLTDTVGGGTKLKVDEVDSTTARDLNILGTATGTTIDGSFEKTITVAATDKLQDVLKKINDLNFGITGQIINDGSGGAPYRLSLTAKNSGRDGRVVFDAGATQLDTHNLVDAQDAAVFVGSSSTEQPLLVTAGKNQLAGVIKGVNVELHGVSDKPVNLSVSRTGDNVVKEVQKFVDGFNELADKFKELTKFDTDTNERGLLLGDSTVYSVQAQLYQLISTPVASGTNLRTFGDVGIKLGDDGKLSLDEDKFTAAYANDPAAVEALFTSSGALVTESTQLSQLNDGRGVRTAPGGANDFRITVKDGSTFDINLSSSTTVGDVLRAINTAAGVKVTAEINSTGNGIKLTDNTTTGTGKFSLVSLNGSLAANDLGISAVDKVGTIAGKTLSLGRTLSKSTGIGYLIETTVNRLIDPVNGVIPAENRTLDSRTQQFKDRIASLDKLIEAKRARLERQFANLESVLSGLQNQQQAIGQIAGAAPARK